ncbi:hypothetical protein MKK84_22305 [Methylobacterium sp. E-065]|uniref:hypothetical protein n=1 Tax=Methylobacterium sp. E-065 TaxID=2836583 RepID=UPI001FBBF787|nr:hypothetical protein [Methylobacterium sp. E-065]MCJ2020129.1 hypothetical protein [Methylobacterium sp. E-065]
MSNYGILAASKETQHLRGREVNLACPADLLKRADKPPSAIVGESIRRIAHRVIKHRLDDTEHPVCGALAAAMLLSIAVDPHQAITPRFEPSARKLLNAIQANAEQNEAIRAKARSVASYKTSMFNVYASRSRCSSRICYPIPLGLKAGTGFPIGFDT